MVVRISVSLSILLCLHGLTGCDGAGNTAKMPDKVARELTATDLEEVRAGLLARDLAFGTAVAERGLAEAYRLFLAEDAVQLPDGDWPLRGREAIYSQILEATRETDFALSWEPDLAEVSVSGDLGYTLGTYWLELSDEEGNPVVIEGNYVNVWRKSVAGVWEVVVDISNQIATDYEATANIDVGEDGAAPGSE